MLIEDRVKAARGFGSQHHSRGANKERAVSAPHCDDSSVLIGLLSARGERFWSGWWTIPFPHKALQLRLNPAPPIAEIDTTTTATTEGNFGMPAFFKRRMAGVSTKLRRPASANA
jgi:hypothetical protein